MRYLKGIIEFGIFYKKRGDYKLIAYTNSDYAEDLKDRKSTSGYLFPLSSGVVKQPVVSLSTIKAEFITAVLYTC